VLNRQRAAAVGQGDVDHAGLLPGAVSGSAALMRSRTRVFLSPGTFRSGWRAENALVRAGDDDVPAGCDTPRWN